MANNHLALALKIRDGKFERIPNDYSEELMRVIQWMIKTDPNERPNVEDLLNLPNVSIRLREKAQKNGQKQLSKKQLELEKKEQELKEFEMRLRDKEEQLNAQERKLKEMFA